MNSRDTVLDLLVHTTGDREAAENLLSLVEAVAHSEGFMAGYKAKEDEWKRNEVRAIYSSRLHLLDNETASEPEVI